MAAAWLDYQNDVATFFCSLGMEAKTDVTVRGVRTTHAVDVLVQSRQIGWEVQWIVECKLWKTPVNKLHVLALREIVTDTGSDRGILLSESGFQSGAKEAASLTNVHLRSLAESKVEAFADLAAMRIVELNDRVKRCRYLYWELPKSLRIEYGLRPDSSSYGYSGDAVVRLAEATLLKAFSKAYPFEADYAARAGIYREFPDILISATQVVAHLEPLVSELEHKLATCVCALRPEHPLRTA